MCSGSKAKVCTHNLTMEDQVQDKKHVYSSEYSLLLEFSASDDVKAFKRAVEDEGYGINESSLWYGRRIGSKKMGLEERTPLMIASLYGSIEVLRYIIENGGIDVNMACGSDGATALHCAAAGGSNSSVEAVKLLLGASADVNSVDANGNKPINLITRNLRWGHLKRKTLEMLLKGVNFVEETDFVEENLVPQLGKEKMEKKEYPVDISLPDINTGVYGSDEFRMYSFKVKPCSRAYSHDWTECPFVHPGENARRRDPQKYHYTCVPCPEFRKGTCPKADNCEYAHGVFESWLHPAQYKTRLCKDEIGCSRKVCFFAHRPEELRPLYASTGSAMPSPKSLSSGVDISTPPMSPSVTCSSPMASNLWQNKINLTPPTLQLPGSRLKTALNARDLELEVELLSLQNLHNQQQQRQKLIDELSGSSSPSYWNKDLTPTKLEDVFGSLDTSYLSQLQGMSPKVMPTSSQAPSPTALQLRQNMNQMRSSYPSNANLNYGFETSGAVATAVMNSRSSAFAKRSQSFIDRGAMSHHRPGNLGLTAAANSASLMSSSQSDWSSPGGKLDWGFQGEELNNKLKKSASFGFRSGNNSSPVVGHRSGMGVSGRLDEPDVSWVHSLVKDEKIPQWADQMYIEQEQIVA